MQKQNKEKVTTKNIGVSSMKENLLTVKEIASCLKMSTRAIWNYRDMGFMPAPIKLRGTVRWREKDIVSWIESGCPDCRKNGRVSL